MRMLDAALSCEIVSYETANLPLISSRQLASAVDDL